MALNAKARIKREYNIKLVTGQYVELYKSVLES